MAFRPVLDEDRVLNLQGSFSVGEHEYIIYLHQSGKTKSWFLFEYGILDEDAKEFKKESVRKQYLVAFVKASSGNLYGVGKTYLLTRFLDELYKCIYISVNSNRERKKDSLFLNLNYSDDEFSLDLNQVGSMYSKIELNTEDFHVNLTFTHIKFSVRVPNPERILDKKTKGVIASNIGVKTAQELFRVMGDRLNFYKDMKVTLVDSNEKFREMMTRMLTDIQAAYLSNLSIVVGLDTETTGLHVYNLQEDNPDRDSIVAIPIAWKDNEAFLICSDMYYFSNVEDDEIYPIFQQIFRRNDDFSFQDIDVEYFGKKFHFNRKNITLTGFNAIFDTQAFLTKNCDVFFDEDIRIGLYNVDTDYIQGELGQQLFSSVKIHNSLKAQSFRFFGYSPAELEDILGPHNEDKFRYLYDKELALLYGGPDAITPRRLLKKMKELMTPQQYKLYRKYDMTILHMLAKAAWRGMPIDTEEVRKEGKLIQKNLEDLQEFIYRFAWEANLSRLDSLKKFSEENGIDFSLVEEQIADSQEHGLRYKFTPANHRKLLFDILGYPIYKRSAKSGEPALDKFVLKKLMAGQRDVPADLLREDLPSRIEGDEPLIDKNKFNMSKYPLAMVFSKFATLNKEYTSYYKPILEKNLEGKAFYTFNMAKAATRRILSPGQTLKGSLKKLVKAPIGWLFMSFDASQIEYRLMASLAYQLEMALCIDTYGDDWIKHFVKTSIYKIFKFMCKEEADYHIETASSMLNKRQHLVTHKERKTYKTIGFGIPYGLGTKSLCEQLFGNVLKESIDKTKKLLKEYKEKQVSIIRLLEDARDGVFKPASIDENMRKYLGLEDSELVGYVYNLAGFYRTFILKDLSREHVERIRRQAGNFKIQSGAAELFRRMLYNFHVGCCKNNIQNKIQWLMVVHDELDALVKDDIDIVLLIKVIYECCTLRYKNHIPYFVGINFGANWYDAKADANELPVIMVQRMIEAYDKGEFSIPSDGRQAENLLILKRHYMMDRIFEELSQIIPNLAEGHVWTDEEVELVDDKFSNYVVRAYMGSFTSPDSTLKQTLIDCQKERERYGFGVSFLEEKLEQELSLDDIDLMNIELLDNSSEEDKLESWFDESNLFGTDIGNSAETDFYSNEIDTEDESIDSFDLEYEINEDAKSSYELYVQKVFKRKYVSKLADNLYSITLFGTPFQNRESEIYNMISRNNRDGKGKIVIVGNNVKNIDNISIDDNLLDYIDKKIQEGMK